MGRMTVVDDSKGPPMGRLLVFVNPHSGLGRSEQVFRQRLQPVLRENRIAYELVITSESFSRFSSKARSEGVNHARSIVQKREDLDTFNALLILSGDGLVFEVCL